MLFMQIKDNDLKKRPKQTFLMTKNLKGGRAPGAYKARFAVWLSQDSYSEDI